MFKSRNFLMGLGIGLIISSLLFVATLNQEKGNLAIPKKENPLTIEELKSAATKYGYQLYTKEEIKQLTQGKSNQSQVEKPSSFLFTIEKGMSSEQVTNLLYDKKIIQDKKQFSQLIEQYNLTNGIRAGIYTYSSDMTLQDIIATITNIKKEK